MKDSTRAVEAGRDPTLQAGSVNPPVHHTSTVVFPTYEDLKGVARIRKGDGVTYAVHGTPTTYALERALTALELGIDPAEVGASGHRTRLTNTGLQGVTVPMLCVLSAGDHLLVPDSVYGETREFVFGMLTRFGVEAEVYDPLIGGGIREHMRPNTRLVLVESPGSWTFEVQDIPAIAEVAHAHGALVMLDNTWATPLYLKPFELGVDISMQALTKYVGGHADILMGSVTATKEVYDRYLQPGWAQIGTSASPDDAYLALRGLRSMPLRLAEHGRSGLAVAEWLMARDEVAEVIHPAMPHDPGHALWQRDFTGAGSLFAIVLEERYSGETQVGAFLDRLRHFAMGFSWGSYQSMALPIRPERARKLTPWPKPGRAAGRVIRLYVGLEDVDDLTADLAEGFRAMRAV
ncbi:MAG: cystathionine beta-lyase [Pseudomonadota bacterium]